MGRREDIQSELAEAFDDPDGLADAVGPVTASRQEGEAYDPVTGTVTAVTITYESRGVFGSYTAQEIDGSLILATDQKLLILQNELTVVPLVGDMIQGLRVQDVGQDPAGATWNLRLRK